MPADMGQPGARGDGRAEEHEDAGQADESVGTHPVGPGPADHAGIADQVGIAEQAGQRRAQLIEAAQAQWIAKLTDLGGRNTLLYYKDRRAGTLDLAAADPDALERFCRTGSIRLTRLFHDVDARLDRPRCWANRYDRLRPPHPGTALLALTRTGPVCDDRSTPP